MSDPEAELQVFLARFTPEIAAKARACRAALRQRLPTAIELVYDNYNALAIGWAGGERLADVICSLAVYPRNVALWFNKGASLPDPDGRLSDKGNVGRSLRLDGPETITEPAIDALIKAALAAADLPLPAPGTAASVVIKSIAPKQRPRRPGEQL